VPIANISAVTSPATAVAAMIGAEVIFCRSDLRGACDLAANRRRILDADRPGHRGDLPGAAHVKRNRAAEF
jgi:hypothetical protein